MAIRLFEERLQINEPPQLGGAFIVEYGPTLEESLSIPTMVSMTRCPKQLIKGLLHLPGSHVVTCPTWLSFCSHLIDSAVNFEDLITDSFSVNCTSSTPSNRV